MMSNIYNPTLLKILPLLNFLRPSDPIEIRRNISVIIRERSSDLIPSVGLLDGWLVLPSCEPVVLSLKKRQDIYISMLLSEHLFIIVFLRLGTKKMAKCCDGGSGKENPRLHA